MQFKSRYGGPLIRILQEYQPGSTGLMAALEAICLTAEQKGHQDAAAELAVSVCESLHRGPSSGLKCLDCHYAETQYLGQQEIEAEVEMVKKAKEAGEIATNPPAQVVEQPDTDDLNPDLLKKILSEITD